MCRFCGRRMFAFPEWWPVPPVVYVPVRMGIYYNPDYDLYELS